MIFLTILSLIYIQMQVQIYALGYQGEMKKSKAQQLADKNGNVAYNISQLTSVNHLGVKLLADDSHMQFPDNRHIVSLVMSQELLGKRAMAYVPATKPDKKPGLLASLFSLKSQAEAGPVK